MFTAETKVRVRYAETDQMGVVYHSNYFQYFEVARAEAIRDLGYTYADMEKEGIMMPIVEVQAKYLRPAFYDQLLTIKAILKELPVNYKIEFHQEVFNENAELLATGRVVLYFMDMKTKKRHSMPESLLEKIRPFFH
ncbi:MAG: acyl-CoA thioesterase [Bacteroidetes bacterium]|nr:acyl-CoA thioesterase [Bacteroidota bacterium]